MARIDTLGNFLTDVATSIRTKKGTTNKITPKDFDTEIESIQSGGGTPNLQEKSITIEENTTTEIVADSDYEGLSKVSVLTNIESFELNDTSYLFYNNARINNYDDFEQLMKNINHLYYMFNNASNFDKPVDLIGKLSDNLTATDEYSGLFQKASKIPSIKISSNSTKPTTLNSMFSGCTALKSIDLTGLNTSNVTDISYIFDSCKSLENVPTGFTSLNTNKVSTTNARHIFNGCESIKEIDLSSMSFPLVTSLYYWFSKCKKAKVIKLPTFGSKKITTLEGLFSGCDNLQQIDFNNLDTSKVVNANRLFGTSTVNTNTDIEGTLEVDLSNFDFSSLKNQTSSILENNKSVRKINLSFLSNITYTGNTFGSMFKNASSLVEIDLTPLTINSSGITSYTLLFENCVRLKKIISSNKLQSGTSLTNIKHMFYNCQSLEAVDLSGLNTTNVKDDSWNSYYNELFYNCQSLKSLDISTFIINPAINTLSKMFYGCVSLSSLKLPDFSKITRTSLNFSYTFYQVGKNNKSCTITNLDTLPWANTSDVSYMFAESSITTGPFENITEVLMSDKNMNHMFFGCDKLTTFNGLAIGPNASYTRNGDYSYLFANCSKLETVDVSNMYNRYEGRLFNGMFQNCTSLKNVKLHNVNKEFFGGQSNYIGAPDYLFDNCKSLEVLDLRYFIGSTGDRQIQTGYGKATFRNCRKLRKLDLRGGLFGYIAKGSSDVSTWPSLEDGVFENVGADNNTPTIVYTDNSTKQQNLIDLGNLYNLGWSTENVLVIEDPEQEVDMS